MTSQNTILQSKISSSPPNIYYLTSSVNIPSSVINLPAGSIFNGNNYTINFTTQGLALFNIIGVSNNATVINDLTVTSVGIFNEGGGGLLESYSKNVILNNCTFNGNILQSDSGGLVGQKCSNIAVVNCNFNGNINNNSGGIIGTKCSKIKIINTNVNANINDKYSGGFVGNSCKKIYIFNCIYNGNIEGKYSGGFVGSKSHKVKIINCTSNANKFNYSGGFCAAYSYDIKMVNCISKGLINKCTASMLACKCGKGGKYIKIIKCIYNIPVYTKLISYTNLTIKNNLINKNNE